MEIRYLESDEEAFDVPVAGSAHRSGLRRDLRADDRDGPGPAGYGRPAGGAVTDRTAERSRACASDRGANPTDERQRSDDRAGAERTLSHERGIGRSLQRDDRSENAAASLSAAVSGRDCGSDGC
jgi:hypothetical protein